MRIVITGALGGIGKHLVETLSATHEVVGIVRTFKPDMPRDGSVRYVLFDNKADLARELQNAEVVIHAALAKSWTKFAELNHALTDELLKGSSGGSCKLFVFFSSWVVYSGGDPGPDGVYTEEQTINEQGRLDVYSRLKVQGEKMVIAACRGSNMGYLIVRPTLVFGSGLLNPDFAVRSVKRIPVGFGGRTINLVHVADVCTAVDRLITAGVTNEVFNLGGSQFRSDDYFTRLGALTGKKVRLLPSLARLRRFLPSTLWFITTDVWMSEEKLKRHAAFTPSHSLERIVYSDSIDDENAGSVDDMKRIDALGVPYKAYGLAYSLLVHPMRRLQKEKRVRIEQHRCIVALHGDEITVKAGTTLTEISAFLDKENLTLATIPEFSGMSAGSCFFVDVHGSSNQHYSLLDLITEVKYLDDEGNIATAKPGDAAWDKLRGRETRLFLTEVTFRCIPSGHLTNHVEFKDESLLGAYLAHEHRKNLSTVIQWYPAHRTFMVHNLNWAEARPPRASKPLLTWRHASLRFQRLVQWTRRLRRFGDQYGRFADIMAPWKDLPFRRLWFRRLPTKAPKVMGLEISLPIHDAIRFIQVLGEMQRGGTALFDARASVGIRFGYRQVAGSGPQGYVWIEWVSRDIDALNRFVEMALEVSPNGVNFHQGKFIPPKWASAVSDGRALPVEVTAP